MPSELWTAKYAPKSIDQVYGNDDARETVKKWALDWQRGKKSQTLLLFGPTGCGKTSLARAVANEMGWPVVEFSADAEKEENAKKALGLSSSDTGLFGTKRMILIDEVDTSFERSGVLGLMGIIKEPSQPVILTANDVWNQKLGAVRAVVHRVEMKGLCKANIRDVLNDISRKEGLTGDIENIAAECKGDLRSAIIDLQASASGSGPAGTRDREDNVFEALRKVFKAKTFNDGLAAGDNVETDFDLFLKWIDENIPNEYDNAEDVAIAFDRLSRADVFAGRIRRRQNYSLLKFVRALGLGGVASAKRQAYHKFTRYQFPTLVKRLGESKENRAIMKSLAEKISLKLHCSKLEAKEFLCYYAAFAKYFQFSEEEESLAMGLCGHQLESRRA